MNNNTANGATHVVSPLVLLEIGDHVVRDEQQFSRSICAGLVFGKSVRILCK